MILMIYLETKMMTMKMRKMVKIVKTSVIRRVIMALN